MTARKDSGNRNYDSWIGHHAYDVNGDKIGKIDHLFYDDRSQRPEWLAVNTGLFGTKTTFIPINGSQVFERDDLQVPFTKDFVKGAPRVDVDEMMSHPQEQELWSYYGYDYAATSDADRYGYGPTYMQARADQDFASGWESDWTPRQERLRRYEDRRAASRR
jgi:PRC-barrel domain